MADTPNAALAKWSHIPSIQKFQGKKANRARIRKNAHTSRLALQMRREQYGAKTELVADLINDVTNGAVTGEKATENLNMANILNMAGILEGFGLNFDALTDQEPCQVYNEKEDKLEPGHRRRSVCEALWEIHDALVGMHRLMLINAQQMNDFIMAQAERSGPNGLLHPGLWRDENGVLLNPYFGKIDEEARELGEDTPDPTPEEQKEGDQETRGAVKEKAIDLDKVRKYVNGNKQPKTDEEKTDGRD